MYFLLLPTDVLINAFLKQFIQILFLSYGSHFATEKQLSGICLTCLQSRSCTIPLRVSQTKRLSGLSISLWRWRASSDTVCKEGSTCFSGSVLGWALLKSSGKTGVILFSLGPYFKWLIISWKRSCSAIWSLYFRSLFVIDLAIT